MILLSITRAANFETNITCISCTSSSKWALDSLIRVFLFYAKNPTHIVSQLCDVQRATSAYFASSKGNRDYLEGDTIDLKK